MEKIGNEKKGGIGEEGKGTVQIAVKKGEIKSDYQSTAAFNQLVRPQVEEGTAIPLYTAGMVEDGQLVRDPAFPEFPSFLEAYREARGSDPSGPAWEAYLALVSSGVSAQRQVWMHGEDRKRDV